MSSPFCVSTAPTTASDDDNKDAVHVCRVPLSLRAVKALAAAHSKSGHVHGSNLKKGSPTLATSLAVKYLASLPVSQDHRRTDDPCAHDHLDGFLERYHGHSTDSGLPHGDVCRLPAADGSVGGFYCPTSCFQASVSPYCISKKGAREAREARESPPPCRIPFDRKDRAERLVRRVAELEAARSMFVDAGDTRMGSKAQAMIDATRAHLEAIRKRMERFSLRN